MASRFGSAEHMAVPAAHPHSTRAAIRRMGVRVMDVPVGNLSSGSQALIAHGLRRLDRGCRSGSRSVPELSGRAAGVALEGADEVALVGETQLGRERRQVGAG